MNNFNYRTPGGRMIHVGTHRFRAVDDATIIQEIAVYKPASEEALAELLKAADVEEMGYFDRTVMEDLGYGWEAALTHRWANLLPGGIVVVQADYEAADSVGGDGNANFV